MQQDYYGFLGALREQFNGFPYLIARVVAAAAAFLPLVYAPLVYNGSAIMIDAGALAVFMLPHFGHIVRDARARMVCCALVVLTAPPEIVGNLTNTSWFLGLACLFVTAMRLPVSAAGIGLVGLCHAMAVFSAPLAPASLPLWGLRAVHAIRGRRWRESSAIAVLTAPLGAVFLVTSRLGADGPAGSFRWAAFLDHVAVTTFGGGLLGKTVAGDLILRYGSLSPYAVMLGALAVLLVLSWRARFDSLPALGWCLAGMLAAWMVTLLGRPNLNGTPDPWQVLFWTADVRYAFCPLALLLLGLVIAVDRLEPRIVRTGGLAFLLIASLLAHGSLVRLPPEPDFHWVDSAHELESSRRAGGQRFVRIRFPPNWVVYVR